MIREKIFPNCRNYYYYEKGDAHIKLVRTNGIQVTYKNYLRFDNETEALQYFETECGA